MEPRLLSFRSQETDEKRLDWFLAASAKEYSRARLQALIRQGCVLIDGKPAKKPSQMVGPGTVVQVRVPETRPSTLLAEDIRLDIVFENQDVLIINKPAGMVVHPAAGHAGGTLANAVLSHDPRLQGIGGENRPGVVHRLDKDTSGLIILAKNDSSLRWLQEQFSQRRVRKTYLALVDGHPPSPLGRVEAAIGRDPAKRKQMAILSRGKGRAAISEFATLETFARHALLEFHPVTGRTHQVRLHCAFLHCPIVGDTVYGLRKPSLPVGRQLLHAERLKIVLPGEIQAREFVAALPEDFSQVLAMLRRESRAREGERLERETTWKS